MQTVRTLAAAVLLSLIGIQLASAQSNFVLNLRSAADYVMVPDSDSLDLIDNFTFEAWVNVSVMSNDGTIIGKRRTTAGTAYAFRISGGKVVLGMNNDFGGGIGVNFAVTSAAEIQLNEWTHVAATYDGTVAKVFINGLLKASSPIKMQLRASTFPVTIGREDLPNEPRSFVGLLDEVRVWKRALSADELQQNMALRLAGTEPGLVAYWNFDNENTTDTTANRNHGTLVGSPRLVQEPLVMLHVYRAVEILPMFGLTSGTYQLQVKTGTQSSVWMDAGQPFAGGQPVQFFDTTRNSAVKVYRVIRVK